jgi:hypothetical protein
MRPAATEHQVQAAIVDALRLAGFTVRETTAYRQKGPSGVDKGIPDLLVCHADIPSVYLGLEVKRPGRWVWSSVEQRQAYEREEFHVVDSPKGALQVACRFLDRHLRLPREMKIRRIERVENVLKGSPS